MLSAFRLRSSLDVRFLQAGSVGRAYSSQPSEHRAAVLRSFYLSLFRALPRPRMAGTQEIAMLKGALIAAASRYMLGKSLVSVAAAAILAAAFVQHTTPTAEAAEKAKAPPKPNAHPTVILQRLAVPKRTQKSGPGVYRSMDRGSTWTGVRP